jgi:hypothetical protein
MHMWRQWHSAQRLVSWRVTQEDGAHGVGVGENAAEMMMMPEVRGIEVRDSETG